MCLILVAWRTHSEYPCVIAANRDERLRTTQYGGAVVAGCTRGSRGRDLSAGGTWLGITRMGRFAALTNYRGAQPPRADAPSRGLLVGDILKSRQTTEEGLIQLQREGPRYNGFNLMLSDGASLGVHETMTGAGRLLGPESTVCPIICWIRPGPGCGAPRLDCRRRVRIPGDAAAMLELLREPSLASQADRLAGRPRADAHRAPPNRHRPSQPAPPTAKLPPPGSAIPPPTPSLPPAPREPR